MQIVCKYSQKIILLLEDYGNCVTITLLSISKFKYFKYYNSKQNSEPMPQPARDSFT